MIRPPANVYRSRPRQRVLGPDDSRAPIRRRQHGLTPAEVDALKAHQDYRCAICLRPDDRLQVDHDHRCHPGRYGCRRCVRGLLCPRCNGALGKLGDVNVDRILRYLAPRR